METISFGPDEKMKFTEPLDTWLSAGLRDFAVPEAVGSSARVFNLEYKPLSGDYANSPAIKIMRSDKTHYALPLFDSEIQILSKMSDVTGVTPMLGLGFVKIDEIIWPDEIAPLSTSLQIKASADQVSGSFDLYQPKESEAILEQLNTRVTEGWLAAIVLPRRWEDNLYLRCDAGYTRGEFHRSFSVLDALRAARQICDIMQEAHQRNIVYLDHKALHYYWNEPRQQVYVLDWNIGRQITNGNSTEVYAFDVLQFSARAMHHLLTGRQAPGSVKVGPNRPEDIQNAPHHYEPVWTYDDQKRLNQDELDFLGAAIEGQYQTFSGLAEDLQSLYNQRQSQS
jgi:serine/threonine protein kinase